MSEKLYLEHTGTPQRFDFDPNGSGRWREGSGKNPHQHGYNFFYEVTKATQDYPGKSKDWIYQNVFNMSTKEARARYAWQSEDIKNSMISRCYKMRYDANGNKKMSPKAIGKELGISTRTVENYLKIPEGVKERAIENTADALRKTLQEYTDKNKKSDGPQFLDVGEGTAGRLKVSEEKLAAALDKLKDEGYTVSNIQVDQINPLISGQKTTMQILGNEGLSEHDQNIQAYKKLDNIHIVDEYYSEDNGQTFGHIHPPVSVDSKRIQINYADENGQQPKDGVIELRPGVADLSLGKNQVYSQVRIAVDDKYYLKGMAIYANDLPDGVDIRFNTNKKEGTPMEKVFKLMKTTRTLSNGDPDPTAPIDKENPFGATIIPIERGGQSKYIDKDGKEQWSCINKVNEEGAWEKWNKVLAPQFLHKQPKELVEAQLDITYHRKLEEYEQISKVTNPTLKKKLLAEFADGCDESAVDLKAWAMPNQTTKVLLPLTTIDEKECYCPDYPPGTSLVCIRYPHSGPMEILRVKNNLSNKQGQEIFGSSPRDVIGISPKASYKLSGADFDGDTVVVIPDNIGRIKDQEYPERLRNFDPKVNYATDGSKITMDKRTHSLEMGKAANLITDMYEKGASTLELIDAIAYSMVIVDAKKHKLNWKQAQEDFNIKALRKKYQGTTQGGASTLISRASGPSYVNERAIGTTTDIETGKKKYRETEKYQNYVKSNKIGEDENGKPIYEHLKPKGGVRKHKFEDGEYTWGKKVPDKEAGDGVKKWIKVPEPEWIPATDKDKVKVKSKKMYEVDDAYELVSDPITMTPKERLYADYANKCKALARKTRLESENIKENDVNKKAAETYAEEVKSIEDKLFYRTTLSPSDRQALRIAQTHMKAIRDENPYMDIEDYKKKSAQAMSAARSRVFPTGKKEKIDITPKEWEAINADAISKTKLDKLFRYTNDEQIKEYAMPKTKSKGEMLSPAEIATIKSYREHDRTWAEIAPLFGVSVSTLKRYVNE